jgi:hypothetical protein
MTIEQRVLVVALLVMMLVYGTLDSRPRHSRYEYFYDGLVRIGASLRGGRHNGAVL